MDMHSEALVRAKQTVLRQQTTKAMIAAAVVVAGGMLRHQLPIAGELVAIAGLLAAGWIGRSIWDASKVDTKFHG